MEIKLDQEIIKRALAWLAAKIAEYEARPVTELTNQELENYRKLQSEFQEKLEWLQGGKS